MRAFPGYVMMVTGVVSVITALERLCQVTGPLMLDRVAMINRVVVRSSITNPEVPNVL